MEIRRQYPAAGMGMVAGPPDHEFDDASQAELVILRAMLADARAAHPRCVLLQGERGIGKTALLRQLSADLSDTRVLFATAEESEAELRFGLVEHLAHTVGEGLPEELAALSDRTHPEPEPFVIGHAVLRLLVSLQRTTPVLLIIDDIDLADVSSQVALLFALRRLHDSRVLTVMATRDPGGLLDGLHKLVAGDHGATITLSGLGHGAVMRLASAGAGPRRPRQFVERLREHTGGNPSHIRAVLDALDGCEIAGVGNVPLPAPPSFRSLVVERLANCGPAGRRLAAAAAVLGERSPFELVRKLAGVEEPLEALQAAIDAGLVEYRGRDVVFVRPLVRAALYHHVSVSERAELHRRAAWLVTSEGARLGHLTAAAFDHDDELAEALADFAARTEAVGSSLSASASFIEAAELVQPGKARDSYALEAVECLLAAGDPAGAGVVAARFVGSAGGPMALVVRSRMARVAGRLDESERLLVRARETCPPNDIRLQARIANDLARLSVDLLRPGEGARRADDAISVVADNIGGGRAPALAWGLALAGRSEDALSLFDVRGPAIDESDPATAGLLLGRVVAELFSGAALQARDSAIQQVRIAGRFERLLLRLCGLALLSLAEYRLGQWTDAVVHADEGAMIADEVGPGQPRALLHLAAILPLAGRGQWDAAELHAERGAEAATTPFESALAWMGGAVLANARGYHGKVIEAVASLRAVGEPGAVDEPGGLWPWQELQVEALIGMGRLDEADAVLRQFELLSEARSSAAATAAAARLRGSLEASRGRERQAHLAFALAKEVGAEVPMPFEQGRTHAECGAFLRRAGKRTAAVVELRSARECFDRLGARPYVARCDRELAAAGLTPQRRRTSSAEELTPQETSVAELVAQGKTNREVANELFLSVNTIEYHLKNIYAKLGISSRSQLTLRFGVLAATQGSVAT